MNKVININLGGKQYTIDEDAYYDLDKYLKAIKKHFTGNNGHDTIIYDIEVRISELFDDYLKGQSIVDIQSVKKMKGIMGMPSDFGYTSTDTDDRHADHNGTKGEFHEKRLFRDPESKMIAGVASGLTAYYGWHSPLLFRLLFVLMAFTFVGILPYILLWIFVPAAKTSGDRLAMNGEEINIDSIARSVEESFMDIKETIEDIGMTIKKKMG